MLNFLRTSRDLRLLATGFLVAALLSVAGLIIRAQSDSVIYGCVNSKNGALRIAADSQCAKGESPLAWNQQGPVGPQGQPGVGGLKVVDKEGRFVGYPFERSVRWFPPNAPFEHQILVPFNDHWYTFMASVNGVFYDPEQLTPYLYEQDLCAGTPYVEPDPVSLYRYPRWVDDDGRTAYVAGDTITKRLIVSSGTPRGDSCSGFKPPTYFDVVDRVAIDLTVFLPPLRFSH
jgi:hypothetical protein